MISKDILKRIKKIEITAKHLVNTELQGEYLSSFKGRGIEFTEVREYNPGDDVRVIDWNVTARMNAPYIKTFIEEREMQVVFAADLSGSLNFGTRQTLKSGLMLDFTAALAFAAAINSDRVGLLGFTSVPEKYIPPKKGKKHVLRILREIVYHENKNKGTDISAAIMHLVHALKKKSTVFIVSDFLDDKDISEPLKILSHRHEVIAAVLRDPAEYEVPDMGIVPFFDPETGQTQWVDTSDTAGKSKALKLQRAKDDKLFRLFRTLGVDYIKLECGRPYLNEIVSFFKKREKRLSR
ncbi:MAG: hypothetical protein BWY84_00826 [Candidatus Aerophobetes bacterium ADurb.Bin490]|nr:MAG: hypothetical protein BWY84_00826 [Candidatus Aerophobetes bacterium ADurb.Bin490]HPI03365.1 DUF58 domain-containing protein [Candidatus Goldiibacteriota bacterium]HPN64473.1 DUF58 domain-containing protein [Candidatus Goldiibacteriota bacterium]HRQ44112.1 DUF58 domain-containing protein [Candidatus Goldiibacteriota bacterium]